MNGPDNSRTDLLATIARWGVGLLFLYMGLNKTIDPEGFLKLVRQYDLPLHYLLLNTIVVALPWFEAFCGLLLLLGVAVRGTSLLLLGMLVPFTIVVARKALEIAELKQLAFCSVKFDCGCGAGEVHICLKIVENCVLAIACLWLLSGKGHRLALRHDLLAP